MSPGVFNPQFWKGLWVVLRRSPKDKSARIVALRIGLSLLIFVGYLIFYVFFEVYSIRGSTAHFGTTLGIFFLGFAALTIVTFILSVVVSRVRALVDRRQSRAEERRAPSVSAEMKRALFREACLLATLLERLGSEAALEKEMAPEVVVITRRVLLDRLSEFGLRDDLEPWLLDLLLAPDGHWSPAQKQKAIPAWECLAVLRWALGFAELRGLTVDPKYNLNDARSLYASGNPEKLFVLPAWDLRPARNAASNFLQRCWSELLARNIVEGVDPNDIAIAQKVREDILEAGFTGDFLIGAQTVTEISSQTLWFMATRAYNRWKLLVLLVDIHCGDEPPETLRKFFARFFASANKHDAEEPAKTVR